jgi:hypothetical protein
MDFLLAAQICSSGVSIPALQKFIPDVLIVLALSWLGPDHDSFLLAMDHSVHTLTWGNEHLLSCSQTFLSLLTKIPKLIFLAYGWLRERLVSGH